MARIRTQLGFSVSPMASWSSSCGLALPSNKRISLARLCCASSNLTDQQGVTDVATVGVNGKSVPARVYMAGLATAKANPAATFKTSLHGWWPATGAEILDQYRQDMHKRISTRSGEKPARCRVSLVTWGKVATPRVVLERCEFRAFNRHAKARLARRLRDTD